MGGGGGETWWNKSIPVFLDIKSNDKMFTVILFTSDFDPKY